MRMLGSGLVSLLLLSAPTIHAQDATNTQSALLHPSDSALAIVPFRSIEEIETYIDLAEPRFDIDGNGTTDAFTDGLLVIRFLAGFTGEPLTVDLIPPDAVRTTPESILEYLRPLLLQD